jgi:hypothetical protein
LFQLLQERLDLPDLLARRELLERQAPPELLVLPPPRRQRQIRITATRRLAAMASNP